MKATLFKTSDGGNKAEKEIEVNTIDDLIKLIEEYETEVILSYYNDSLCIEIYDEYRE